MTGKSCAASATKASCCTISFFRTAFPFPARMTSKQRHGFSSGLDGTLLIDGLAFGALPAGVLSRIKARIVALVHHPLALETGLGADDAERLRIA